MGNLSRKRNTLLKKLNQYSECVRGSINSVCATCNRASCICKKTSSKKAYRLTYKDDEQKTRIVYIPRNRLRKMRKMITNYTQVRKIIGQLVELNIEEFKMARS